MVAQEGLADKAFGKGRQIVCPEAHMVAVRPIAIDNGVKDKLFQLARLELCPQIRPPLAAYALTTQREFSRHRLTLHGINQSTPVVTLSAHPHLLVGYAFDC